MASSALAVVVTHPEAIFPAKLIVQITPGEEHLAVFEAERVLAETGLYYVSGGQLARLVPTAGSMQCEVVNSQTLYVVMSEMIEWQRPNSKGEWVTCNPPHHLLNTLIYTQDRKYLQTLMGIAHQPYFDANEQLVTTPGFNSTTGIYASFGANEYAISAPTEEDAQLSLMALKAELAEFEFEKAEDLSAALCAMLTAAIRPGLPLAPAFNFNAASSGSGKSFLAGLVVLFATPLHPYVTSYPTTATEAIKVILAMLLEKPPVILFDDMQTDWKPFGAINKALTSHTTTERLLGKSGTATARTNSLFLGTGNNTGPIKDMRRRVVTARLAAKSSLRTFERNPQKQISKHRSVYVGFALTIIQAFLLHGKRDDTLTSIGSYEDWSRFCREPLIWLGEPDPALSLINQVKDNTDDEALAVLLKLWRDLYHDESMTVRELLSEAPRKPKLQEIIDEILGVERGASPPHLLGQYLKRHRGVRVNGLRIEDGYSSERKAWRVLTDYE
ncbi:hypothetical protein [Brevundimonas halotolerans]|uniref:DUF927 domain-containing protein n=1 Tax=Brevundimonas halotolerans TaxID=69670 RepID=A0A7W9A2R3_9CAUL|nr:hypothetical protein [Brevundimonas halotolerans]MBB5660364.1 hypothetical protein [Brevundimonas halotolerans]